MSFTDTRGEPRGPDRPHASRHTPDPRLPNIEELLVGHRAATHQLLDAHGQMMRVLEKVDRPARVEPFVLTATNPIQESGALQEPTRSIGLYNPTGSLGTVRAGVMGSAGVADAFPVPPGRLLVLPISAGIVEVGTNAPLQAADSLYCFLLRYSTVQPAFLGGDEGEPPMREFNIAQPAAAAELSAVVPAGQWWKLHTLRFSLATSANAGGRNPQVVISDSAGNARWQAGPVNAQPISSAFLYQYARLGPVVSGQNGNSPNGPPWQQFLPDIWIPPGYSIATSSALQAGDQYSVARGLFQVSTEAPDV